MFLGISLRIPLILVITLQDRKLLFCVFFRFRDLYGLKLTGDFSWIIIFQYMTKLSFEITQTESRRCEVDPRRWTCGRRRSPRRSTTTRPTRSPTSAARSASPGRRCTDTSKRGRDRGACTPAGRHTRTGRDTVVAPSRWTTG